MLKNLQKGFTLIELMIVIGIISFLSVGILTIVNPADQLQKANDSRRKSDLTQIQKALEQYYQDNGRYPPSDTSLQIVGVNNNILTWGTPWTPYMNLLPKDPSSSKKYVYIADSIGQSYFLYASLERGAKDNDACKDDGTACSSLSIGNQNACNGVCNYGVSSPNTSP